MSKSMNLADIAASAMNGRADRLIREMSSPPFQRALKAASDLLDSPAAKAARGAWPAARAALELHDSPAMRAARELHNSPAMRIARELEASVAGGAAWNEMRRQLEDARRHSLLFPASGGTDATTVNAFLRPTTVAGIAATLAYQYGEIAKRHSLFDKGHFSSSLAEVARANQWANQLAQTDAAGLAALMPTWSPIMGEVERIWGAAMGMVSASAEVDRLRLSSALGLGNSLSAEMEVTRLKLSALAGASDILGFASRTSLGAYEQLFGDWRTRPDFPQRFWRDPATRRERYRQAEVDPGLIEAAPDAAVEVVIESGFATGISAGGISVVLLDIAGVSVQIRSSDPGGDAFRAITAFERVLRGFIVAKLEAVSGPKWFKQRVNGDICKKAYDNRAKALADGEREKAPIAYLDLGDLSKILLRGDNWDGAFGQVFPNQQRLRFDLEALIAGRRPTMHARSVDAVRLMELICIIRRLSQWIEDNGEWKRIAASDD
jgi:hypothetical protein